MKHIFIFLLIFPTVIFAQSKITDIIWKGQNKEYLELSKKYATLNKGQHIQGFKVVKYAKNEYIILASQHITGYLEQKYDIVRFTRDTLILAPVGRDIFKLSQPNENNQYVFVNSLNGFTFGKLHFATSLVARSAEVAALLFGGGSNRRRAIGTGSTYLTKKIEQQYVNSYMINTKARRYNNAVAVVEITTLFV